MSQMASSNTVQTALHTMRTFTEDLSSSLSTTTLTSGAAIVAGLLVLSFLLYMFDTWATARIDTMLLDYYGPDLYRKMTSSYDPEGVAAAIQNINSIHSVGEDEISDRFGGHFDGWSDEDVIRAYLVHHLRKQENANQMQQLEYSTPMRPMFTSSSQLEGYRSMSGNLLADGVKFILDLYRKWKH